MEEASTIVSIGAIAFGVVVGWITYRTLRRRERSANLSDIAAVIAAIGGGAVTALYGDGNSDAFGWYSVGLAGGFFAYLIVAWIRGGGDEIDDWLGD